MSDEGRIYRISGPVVTAIGIDARMYDMCRVGDEGPVPYTHLTLPTTLRVQTLGVA